MPPCSHLLALYPCAPSEPLCALAHAPSLPQVLLDYQGANGHSNATLEGELQPTHIVHGLEELEQLLADQYQLLAPASPHAAVVAMDGKTE